MPLKNTVAVERRMDLASLFCMISRHGPAVALAVIAMVSVLAAFIIYRTVRGKRRKATAADGDGQSRGEERDAAVIDPCTEEGYSSVESTDVCDEASSDIKEDLIQSDLRHRHIAAAAAEEKPSPYSPLKSDIQVSDTKHPTSDDTGEMGVVWDSYKAEDMFAEEASQDLQSDTNKAGDMVVDYQQGATDPGVKDVIEEVHDNNRCLRDPEPTNYEHEEKMVLKAEYHEDDDEPTDKEENNFLCALNSSEETCHVGEVGDGDRLHNNKTSSEINSVGSSLEEPVIVIKDVPDTPLNCSKEEQFEEEVQDIVDGHSYSSNNGLSPKEEKQYEGMEAEEGCVDHPATAQQAEMWSSTPEEETNVPSIQQDQHDHVTEEATAVIGDDDGPASEVIEEMLEENYLHKLAVKSEDHLAQFDSEEVDFDHKEENDLAPNQEDGVLFGDADQVKEEVLASDNSMACGAEPDSSNAAPPCLSIPVEVASQADLSGVITEAKAHISGSTDFSDMSSDCQQPQLENIKPLSLDEETDSFRLCPDMPTNESVNQPENDGKGTTVELAEEHNDPMYDPHIQPCYEDQKSVTAVHDDVSDKVSVAADPDTVRPACDIATTTSPMIFEEVFTADMCPSQDQQSDHMENKEILDETRAESTTDAPACDNTTTTSPIPAEEISHADMLSPSQDQQRDLMENDEMLAETIILSGTESTAFDNTTIPTPITAVEISQTDMLPPSPDQQSDLMENTETFAEPIILSGTEATALDKATIPSPITAEEISQTDMLSPSQEQQNDLMENIEKFAETMILSGTDATVFDKAAIPSPIICEYICHTDDLTTPQSQQSEEMENNEKFVETRDISNMDAPASADATTTPTADEISHMDSLPPYQDQQSGHSENIEIKEETQTNSANDTPACDNISTSLLKTAEETSPEMMFSSQEQKSEQTKNKEDFSEVTTAVPPTISPPICQIPLLCFEQSEIRENDISPSGADEESGISSMAVSPDLQDAGNEFDVTDEHTVQAVMEDDLQSKGKTGARNSLFVDDITVSFCDKGTHTQTGMVFGLQPIPSQLPEREQTDWKTYESFVVNEDMLGCEIEDSYHREMSQFMAQIAASVTSSTDEQKLQTDMKAVEVVEMKKTRGSVEKKEQTKAGEEKEEEDFERTEISIMEATMDNNEWITESNYQVPPWLNLSASSSAQDHTKTIQAPTEECQYGSVVSDTTDIPPPPEVKQTSSPAVTEENLENNKKVVAVQPMPQNVNVTFRVHYFTQSPYQTVAITGDQQELGNWKGFIPLERAKDGHWATVVSLPAESHVEWKFVVVDKGEVCRWEECGNRLLDTGYGEDVLVHKWWGHL